MEAEKLKRVVQLRDWTYVHQLITFPHKCHAGRQPGGMQTSSNSENA